MSWFAFALLCLLGWGFADLFYKMGSDENDRYSHLKIAVWVGLVMGVCALILLPFSESFAPGRKAVTETGTYVLEEGGLHLTSAEGCLFSGQTDEDGEYLLSYTCLTDEKANGEFYPDLDEISAALEKGEAYEIRGEGLLKTLTLDPDGTYVFYRPGASLSDFVSSAVKYTPASLCYIISMVIGYAGLRYLELSIVSPVQNASGAFSAVAMLVFFSVRGTLGDHMDEFSPLNVIGVIFVAAGMLALAVVENRVNGRELKTEDRRLRYGALALIFPILYCIFDTIGTAADGIILDESTGLGVSEIDVLILYGLTFLLAGIAAWVYMLIKTKKAYNPFAKSEKYKGIAALCEECGQFFYVFAMAEKPVIAAPVVASYCIVSVILSRVFVKEKLKLSQYLCVIAVIIGIVLMGIAEGIGEA
ncbi:MAG: DMT family transporter [Clostridiales bacterium]|nr:DMT family transporter [Clostridiales bacterium]